jgi:hypothetical protein
MACGFPWSYCVETAVLMMCDCWQPGAHKVDKTMPESGAGRWDARRYRTSMPGFVQLVFKTNKQRFTLLPDHSLLPAFCRTEPTFSEAY